MSDRWQPPPGRGEGTPAREPLVDWLKIAAAQLIVWHHLALYRPMSERASSLWPAAFDFLALHGRLAVPVFLVIGGYLAARSLAPDGRLLAGGTLGSRLVDRHLRLSVPFIVVVAFAVVASWMADHLMDDPAIPVLHGGWQLLTHALLLHDLLGQDALTAGAWYVAIDFQLYAMLLLVLTLARRGERQAWNRQRHGPLAVAALGGVSMLVFNRMPELDITGFYFFGAYALGALVGWWAPAPHRRWRLLGVGAVVALALVLQWRERVAVAGAVAAALAVASMLASAAPKAGIVWSRARARWSDRSYALFLVHFPVLLLVNAVFSRWAPADAIVQATGLLLAWALSLGAAWLFHERVEGPLARHIGAWRRAATGRMNASADAAAGTRGSAA